MSVETAIPIDTHAAVLQSIWIDCFRSVLSQVAGSPITVETANEQQAGGTAEPEKSSVWALFTASKALHGEMAIQATETGALSLAQLLVSEPSDPTVPFDKDRRDAFEEVLRQVLGQVATSLKGPARGDVEIKLSGTEAPSWQGAARLGIQIKGEKLPALHLVLVVTPELAKSFPQSAEANAPPARKPIDPPMAQGEITAPRSSNLELLLDVKLDATIRFGQKHMLLRDVLELHPGAAVVLDRLVEEPVELLVGGNMVARGEVVIVDGNYGLRITEILSPQQRIESLRT